jgi:UDP-N-acetylglucosamine 2-epimerase (non-hydrolysing)
MTDSGGVQEETCLLRVPCVTLRDNTERPETVTAGGNMIAGTTPEGILRASLAIISRKRNWPNPFGGGNAAANILKVLRRPTT